MSDKETTEKKVETFKIQDNEEIDDITRAIGKGGRWQVRVTVILSMVGIMAAFHMMVISFFTPNADHWCKPPDVFGNWSVEKWKNYSIPPAKDNQEKLSKCLMYERDYSKVPPNFALNKTATNKTTACKYGWDYNTARFKDTLENEFNLVCEREYLAKTGAATYNIGVLVGVLIFGQLSDLIGRKKTLLISLALSCISGIITSFVPSLAIFYFIRFFIAMGAAGTYTSAFVLAMEMVDGDWRTKVGIGFVFPWCVGYIGLAGIAYLIPDWRNLQLTISIPIVLHALYWWFVPESIRWLYSQGRVDETEELATAAAKENKLPTPVKFAAHTKKTSIIEKETLRDLLNFRRYPNVFKRTINLYFNWFVNVFVYYGLSLGTATLGGNLYVTFLISGAIEVPAYIFSYFVLMRYGRRWPHCLTMVVGGVACIATAGFTKGVYPYDWPIVTLAMIGKFGISASFAIVYVFAAELYPTVVRNVGIGSSSMCARFGSIIAPYVDLLRYTHPAIPLVLFGLLSVVAGLLVLLLPETNNKPLPQTLEDAEKFGR